MVLSKGGRGVPWVQLGGGTLEVYISDYNTHPYLTPPTEFRYEDYSGRPVGPKGTHGVGNQSWWPIRLEPRVKSTLEFASL